MSTELPEQRPEGKLLQEAQKASGRSIRQVAEAAGMSDARWRQIVKGWMRPAPDVVTAVVAPATTLAKMAIVVDVTAEDLRRAGRDDAAAILAPFAEAAKLSASEATPPAGQVADEIDMIYASESMTAEQKLKAIRQVLQLRAQVERDRGARNAAIRRRLAKQRDDDTTSASSGQSS
jgi:hypothetical protein